jgi:hypothetical protein
MNAIELERTRKREFAKKAIIKFDLNLDGLTVFTEAATGNYLYTPIIAALAGADRVFAVTSDSEYGKKEEVKARTVEEAVEMKVDSRITVLFTKDPGSLTACDILTNSGFVRPITREMISSLKPTAVIPLMWETWEHRPQELDLPACQENGILVMGTDEHHPTLNLFHSIGFKVCKLLFEAGLSVYQDRMLLVGSGDYGDSIAGFFIDNKISFDRLVLDDRVQARHRPFIRTRNEVLQSLAEYDALIVAEMYNNVDILAAEGVIPTRLLRESNPLIHVLFICGSVNTVDLAKDNLILYPDDARPFGHIRVSADYLGWKPTLDLIAAGLKVGEVMARCRLRGLDIDETIHVTLRDSPAQAFEEENIRA